MKSQKAPIKWSLRKILGTCFRKSPQALTASEEQLFLHSKPLEDVYPKPANSFTIMPCRVPLQYHIVQTAVEHFYSTDIVRQVMNEGNLNDSATILDSPIGRYSTLIYPECLPERLETVTLIVEGGTLYDDVIDGDSCASLKEDMGRVLKAGNFNAKESTRGVAMQKWMMNKLLETINLYGKEGRVLFHNCQRGWLDMWDTSTEKRATTFEDYISQRIRNYSLSMLWAVAEFSLGILLTPEESKLVQPLTDMANRIIVQTNDYFGWEVDRVLQKDRIFNLVLCITEEHGIAEKAAKERLKSLIMHDEEMYQSMLDNFYKTHPNLPVYLRKYVAAGPLFVGGNHNWSAGCRRYKPKKPHEGMTLLAESTQMKAINIIPDLEQIVMDNRCTPYTAPDKIATVQAIEGSRLDDSALLAAPRYVQSLPSKNIRSKLADALNIWFQLPEDRLDMLKGVINDLHNATLILDDIQDESILRRGSSAAHCIFGPAQCINSATYMVIQAALRLHHHNNLEAIGTFLQGLSDLALGQSWDLNWKVNSYCPFIGEYFAMVDGKTGALFKMLVHLMQSVSSLKRFPVADLDRFTQLLGRWYQIRDDYQNLQDPEYTEQKGFCEDLDEGKLSYPVVLCCNSNPTSRTIILGIFRRTKNGLPLARSVKMQILDLLRKSGALVETWKIIQQLEKDVRDSLSTLEQTLGEPNPPLRLVTELLGDIPSPQSGE